MIMRYEIIAPPRDLLSANQNSHSANEYLSIKLNIIILFIPLVPNVRLKYTNEPADSIQGFYSPSD